MLRVGKRLLELRLDQAGRRAQVVVGSIVAGIRDEPDADQTNGGRRRAPPRKLIQERDVAAAGRRHERGADVILGVPFAAGDARRVDPEELLDQALACPRLEGLAKLVRSLAPACDKDGDPCRVGHELTRCRHTRRRSRVRTSR